MKRIKGSTDDFEKPIKRFNRKTNRNPLKRPKLSDWIRKLKGWLK